MELRDLKAFVTLGEVLHFGQAAARQHITQSALSKQIRRLEVAFGGELFERNASSTRLTPLGRALYGDACALVAQSEQLGRTAPDPMAPYAAQQQASLEAAAAALSLPTTPGGTR